jgi:hypothetical protein
MKKTPDVFIWYIAAVVLALPAIGCGRQEPPPAATPSVTPSPSPTVALVSQAELRAAVPELRGWTRSEISTQQSEAPTPGAHATATFTRGVEKMELEVADRAAMRERSNRWRRSPVPP